jgi:hypothetical protein
MKGVYDLFVLILSERLLAYFLKNIHFLLEYYKMLLPIKRKSVNGS